MTWVPGEKLLIRMWESIEKLGTGMLSPRQIMREGRARNAVREQEIMVDAQARYQANEILAGRAYFDSKKGFVPTGQALLPSPSIDQQSSEQRPATTSDVTASALQIPPLAVSREHAEATKRLLNVRAAVRAAEEEVDRKGEQDEGGGSTLEDDWLNAWRRGAENTSQEDLQRLWGRVLAGELRSPKSFGLRTLAYLQSLDKTEADAIAEIGPFTSTQALIFYPDEVAEFFKNRGLNFSKFLGLEEAGLLSGVSGPMELAVDLIAGAQIRVPLRGGPRTPVAVAGRA